MTNKPDEAMKHSEYSRWRWKAGRDDPFSNAYTTTSGGYEQETRYHLALDKHAIHAVLQYRGPRDVEWTHSQQAICGIRDFKLCDAHGKPWCRPCWDVYKENRG